MWEERWGKRWENGLLSGIKDRHRAEKERDSAGKHCLLRLGQCSRWDDTAGRLREPGRYKPWRPALRYLLPSTAGR